MNKLPVIDAYNVKRIIVEGIKSKIDEIRPLKVDILVHTDYPSSANNPTDDTGETVQYRRIVVKRLSTATNINAIGDVYAGENNLTQPTLVDEYGSQDELAEAIAHGWYEDHTIELSVWCRDVKDRDNLLELLRIFMLELNHRNLENGAPYFYNNRIYSVRFSRAYESQDVKIIDNNPHYIGVLEYSLSAPVYGTTVEEYEKLKYSIISELDPGKDGVIIVNPDHPHFPGGGGGSDGTIPDLYVAPKESYGPHADEGYSKEVLYVGGPLKTDSGALEEHVYKELEDD